MLTIIVLVKDRPAEPHASRKKAELKQLPGKYYFFLGIIILFTLGNSTDALLLVKTQETGVNNAFVPLIYMLFNMVSVILAVPIGKLSDRIDREKLIVAGFLVYAVVYFLFGLFNDIRVFIPLFMLYGLYSALTDSSQKAIISDIVGKEVKGMGYGIYHAVLGITLFPASLIAGLLYDKINASAPFYFGGTMALLAAVLMVLFTLFYMKKTKKEQAA